MKPIEAYELALKKVQELKESGIRVVINPTKIKKPLCS